MIKYKKVSNNHLKEFNIKEGNLMCMKYTLLISSMQNLKEIMVFERSTELKDLYFKYIKIRFILFFFKWLHF